MAKNGKEWKRKGTVGKRWCRKEVIVMTFIPLQFHEDEVTQPSQRKLQPFSLTWRIHQMRTFNQTFRKTASPKLSFLN